MSSKLSFSYSKMGMYKECPQKYKFRYIDRIPEKPKYYFSFGSALHKVMEYIYGKGSAFPPIQDTINIFTADWHATSFEDKGYASKEKEDEGFAEGLRIIDAYYKKHSADIISPVSTEFRTTVEIDGLSVIGILDRIDYLGGGKISILDYKTGKTLKREPDQLMMYQKITAGNPQLLSLVQAKDPAVKEVNLERMLFYHLPTLKEQAFEPAPKEEIDVFWHRVLTVAQDIMAAKFGPDPEETKCRFCDYKALCPVWNLSPSQQEEVKAENSDPLAALADKIDALGAARDEEKKLTAEIMKIMEENGFNRHFGKKYSAVLDVKENIDFPDPQKTVDELRSMKLLPKVLVPTLGSITKLLESGNLTDIQKEKLTALSKKVKETKLICTKTEE